MCIIVRVSGIDLAVSLNLLCDVSFGYRRLSEISAEQGKYYTCAIMFLIFHFNLFQV